MARLSAKLIGGEALRRRIADLTPDQNRRIVAPALVESMLLTLRIAAREKIHPGSRSSGPPKPKILTSRHGGAGLVGSLGRNEGLDKSGLPNFIEGGTHLVYGKMHEGGLGPFPPRPFLGPALADAQRQYGDIFEKHWKRAADL